MIVARTSGRLRLVAQVAHQDQCRLLAAAWGNELFRRPQPWQPVVDAAGVHDEGWRTWEEAPGVMPDGTPRGFDCMEPHEHVAIHRASAAAAAARGDAVGLVVGMHVAGLVMRRLGIDGAVPTLADRPQPARELVVWQAADARARRARLGEGPDVAGWAWTSYRILQAIDLLSLYLTWRGLAGGESWSLPRVPRCQGDERGVDIAVTPVDELTCRLDPWPFGPDELDARVQARVVPDLPYPDAAALGLAINRAPAADVVFRLVGRPHGGASSRGAPGLVEPQ